MIVAEYFGEITQIRMGCGYSADPSHIY